MKKLIISLTLAILLLGLAIPQKTKAQNYHPLIDTNKVWSVLYSNDMPPWNYVIERYKFYGDTIINFYSYKKVMRTDSANDYNWYSYGYIREDTLKKVFYVNYSGETLLYNFNANVNDTVQLLSGGAVVDSINFINITGGARKQFFIRSLDCSETDIWIEGIGSLFGVLYSGYECIVGGNWELLCFIENDTIKYHNPINNDCYIITDNQEVKNNSIEIQIYPNPANNYLMLNFKGIKENTIFEIYNLYGQFIDSYKISSDITQIPLNKTLQKGLYFYKIKTIDEIIKTGKIVIE